MHKYTTSSRYNFVGTCIFSFSSSSTQPEFCITARGLNVSSLKFDLIRETPTGQNKREEDVAFQQLTLTSECKEIHSEPTSAVFNSHWSQLPGTDT